MAEKKIIDVAGPTDAKVDIGSKPMIVGHKSMASDPMMREKLETAPETSDAPPEASPGEVKEPVQEITETKSDTVEPPSVKQKTIEPLSEVNKPTEKAPETVVPEETEKPKTDEQVKTEKANAELDKTALELEKEENLRKIIESKKYHVNIKQARGDSKSWIYIAVGLIVSALIALFVLVDTGKLDIGVNLPFSIFGNDSSSSAPNSSEVSKAPSINSEETTKDETAPVVVSQSKITEVDLLLKEPGDELKLPDTTPESFVEYMKGKLVAFECDSDTGGITVSKISDEFVSGGVGCEGGFSAVWYQNSEIWQEFGSQDTPPCTDVESLKIPIEFVATCIDMDTAKEKPNPNGSIDQ